MEKAGDILKEIFKGDLSIKGEKYTAFFRSWERILGKELSRNVHLIDINKDTLQVQTSHPGWLQMISLKKDKLIFLINRLYPELAIKKMRVFLRNEVGRKESPAILKDKNLDKKNRFNEEIEVKNDELKGVLKRLYTAVLNKDKNRK